MLLKNLDYLSPQITLFYNGNRKHSTIFGAILTLVLFIISIIYITNLIINISNHELSNFVFYRNYKTDISQYYFNDSTGIFHYFQIFDTKTRTFGEYNTKYVRIIMSRLYETYEENKNNNLYENEHWVYDLCRKGIDNQNLDNEVFNEQYSKSFEIGACLRYYYDTIKHTYIKIEDKINFKYPYLIHGDGNNNNLYLETIVEKCQNSSLTKELFGNCGTQNEIDEYLEKYKGIYLQLLERQVNTDNYTKPILQYIYGIGTSLNNDSVSVNNINLFPFEINIKKGIAFPKTKKIITYAFDDNRKTIWQSRDNKAILSIFIYWLHNSGQVLKGGYSSIYDILPDIGGFIQLIYFILYSINYIYNKYIIILDCNKEIFTIINNEDQKEAQIKKTFYDDILAIRDEVKFREDSKILAAMQKRDSIFITKKARQKKNSQVKGVNNQGDINNNNNFSNSNDLMNNIPNNNLIMNNITVIKNIKSKHSNQFNYNGSKIEEINIYDKEKMLAQFSNQIKEYINNKNNTFKAEPLNSKATSHFISFFNYLMSSIFKHPNKKRIFNILNHFRSKILGEEHFFKTNTILYHLEQYFDVKETKKIDVMDLYENL